MDTYFPRQTLPRRVPPPPPKISAGSSYTPSRDYHPQLQQRPMYPSAASVRPISSSGYREWDEDRDRDRRPPAYYTGGDEGTVKLPSKVSFSLDEDYFKDRSGASREEAEAYRQIWAEEFKDDKDRYDSGEGGTRTSGGGNRNDEAYEYARRYESPEMPPYRPTRHPPPPPPLERPERISVPRNQMHEDLGRGEYVPAWKKPAIERYLQEAQRKPGSSADVFDESFFVGSPEVRSGRSVVEDRYSARNTIDSMKFADSDFSDERFLQRRRLADEDRIPVRRPPGVPAGIERVDPALRVFKPSTDLRHAESDQPSRWAPSRHDTTGPKTHEKTSTEELRRYPATIESTNEAYVGAARQHSRAVEPCPSRVVPTFQEDSRPLSDLQRTRPVAEVRTVAEAIPTRPKRAEPQPNRSIPLEDGMVQVLKEINGKVTQGVFHRKVTHIESEKEMGFAGRDIFFHMRRVKGPLVPVVGDKVSVIAEKTEMLPFDWTALSIEVISPQQKQTVPYSDVTIPLNIPANLTQTGQRKPPPPPVLSKPKPAKRAKSPDSPIVLFDGMNIKPLPRIKAKEMPEAKKKSKKARTPSPKHKKQRSASRSPPPARRRSRSPSPPKALKHGRSRSKSPVVRKRPITPTRRRSRSITPPLKRRPRSRSITPPVQRRPRPPSVTPPPRSRVPRSRSISPLPRSRLPRSRSISPPPRSRLPRSRSITPTRGLPMPRQRSISPPVRSRLPRSRSTTPPRGFQSSKQRSITPPLRVRITNNRTVSPLPRRQRSSSRSVSPLPRRLRSRSRSFSPALRLRRSPSPVRIMRDRRRSRSRSISPQKTVRRRSPSPVPRRRDSRSPIPTASRRRSRSRSPMQIRSSPPPSRKLPSKPKKKLEAKVAPVVKKDPPKIIVGKRIKPKAKVQEPAYKLLPPEQPKPKPALGLAPEVMREAQERVTRAKKELEAAMHQKANPPQQNAFPNPHFAYGPNPPPGPGFYNAGFYGPTPPNYGPAMPPYGPMQTNPSFFTGGPTPMYRHPGMPVNLQPTQIKRTSIGSSNTSAPAMVSNPMHKTQPSNTVINTSSAATSSKQTEKVTPKSKTTTTKTPEKGKAAEKLKEAPPVAKPPSSTDKNKVAEKTKETVPSAKKKEEEKPKTVKESPKPEPAKKSESGNQVAQKSILKGPKPAVPAPKSSGSASATAELLADENFMAENDFMDPQEAERLGCDPEHVGKAQKWMTCLRCAQDGHLISMCDKNKTKRALPFDIAKAKNRMAAKKKEILSKKNVQIPQEATKAQAKSAAVAVASKPKRSVSFESFTKQSSKGTAKPKQQKGSPTSKSKVGKQKPVDKRSNSSKSTKQSSVKSAKPERRKSPASVRPMTRKSHPIRRRSISPVVQVHEGRRSLSPLFITIRQRSLSPSPTRIGFVTADPLAEVEVKKLKIQSLELREMEIEQEMRLLQAISAQNMLS